MKDFSNFHLLDNETNEVKNTINDKWGSIENLYKELYRIASKVKQPEYNPNSDLSIIREKYEETGANSNFDDLYDEISAIVDNEVLSENKDQLF